MRYHDTIVIVSAPLVSSYGGQMTRDWANATRSDPVSANVQPDTATETEGRTDTSTTRYRAFCGPSTPVDIADRVEWEGRTYDVQGEPERWKSMGKPHHIELRMLRHGVEEDTP